MAYEMQIRQSQDRAKIRSPWAAALLPLITFGIYHLVWWYRINREMRDYGKAKGYDLGQNPTNSVLALFPGGLIIVPGPDQLLAWDEAGDGCLSPGRTGAAQRLDRDPPLPLHRPGSLGLYPGLAESRMGAGSRTARGSTGSAAAVRSDAAAASARTAGGRAARDGAAAAGIHRLSDGGAHPV